MPASRSDTTDPGEIDPRKLRSRARLLDAATTLLKTGGVQAVTVDAVTALSKVARTTMYRHFDSTADLLTATFERLVPQVAPPATEGPLREQLIELITRQALLIEEAPLQLTTLAWMAMSAPESSGATPQTFTSLRDRVIEQYRRPFDAAFHTEEARKALGDYDIDLALAQLIGPIVFAKLTGLRTFARADCTQLVDDFLRARALDQ